MECTEVARLLADHALDELEAHVCAAVGAHLSVCSVCACRWSAEDDSELFRGLLAPLRVRGSIKEAVMAKL